MNKKKLTSKQILNASPEQLIRAYSPWIKYIAAKYRSFLSRSGVFDFEDLYWSGAMALVDSKETWDPEKGSFLTHSFYEIRSAIQKQLSFGKKEIEPELVYLDAPLPYDEDLSLVDTIPSDDKSLEEIAENQELRSQIQAAMDRSCDSFGQEVLKKRYYDDMSIKEVAAALGTDPAVIQNYSNRSLNRLRRDYKLRQVAFRDYYRRVGLSEFKSTLTSEVELALIRKEQNYNIVNGPGAYFMKDEVVRKHGEEK